MVGHYLWGIDTLQRMKFHQEFSLWTSDITYEELTHCTQICHWSDLMSDITYEELTPVSSLSSLTAPSIGRTLPMRNWHASNNPVVVSRKNIFVGHYLWGIDTIHTIHSKAFIENFILSDITYEELTHAVFSEVVASSDTSSGRTLPMRNWHWKISTLRNIPSFCRTLPMRNWHVYGIRTFQFVLSSDITFPTRIPCANT